MASLRCKKAEDWSRKQQKRNAYVYDDNYEESTAVTTVATMEVKPVSEINNEKHMVYSCSPEIRKRISLKSRSLDEWKNRNSSPHLKRSHDHLRDSKDSSLSSLSIRSLNSEASNREAAVRPTSIELPNCVATQLSTLSCSVTVDGVQVRERSDNFPAVDALTSPDAKRARPGTEADLCELFGIEMAQGVRAISDIYTREKVKQDLRATLFAARFPSAASAP